MRRQLLFRFGVSFLVATLSFYLLSNSNVETQNSTATARVYVKYNYNLLCVPLRDGSQFVWLADKKPNTKYYKDAGLIQYFQDNNIKHIGINGTFGKAFVEENCAPADYTVWQLNFPKQRELEKRYLDGKFMSQIMR